MAIPNGSRSRSPLRGYGVRGVSNRLMMAAASGHLRRRRPIEFGRVVVGLAAHRCSAFSTDVVVLTAARQNEQELSPRWSRAATARAKEAGRLKLAEGIGPGHDLELYTRATTGIVSDSSATVGGRAGSACCLKSWIRFRTYAASVTSATFALPRAKESEGCHIESV